MQVLSNFGVRYFLEEYTDTNTIPTTGTNELKDLLSCTLGGITQENKKYKTLGGNGWDSIATLGKTQEDASFEAIRTGTGDVYTGGEGTTTYNKIRNWIMGTNEGGVSTPKCIVEVVPRGKNIYEGTCYFVMPSKFTPATRDTETGQEYSFDVTPFGQPIPIKVTHASELDTWTFAKVV